MRYEAKHECEVAYYYDTAVFVDAPPRTTRACEFSKLTEVEAWIKASEGLENGQPVCRAVTLE